MSPPPPELILNNCQCILQCNWQHFHSRKFHFPLWCQWWILLTIIVCVYKALSGSGCNNLTRNILAQVRLNTNWMKEISQQITMIITSKIILSFTTHPKLLSPIQNTLSINIPSRRDTAALCLSEKNIRRITKCNYPEAIGEKLFEIAVSFEQLVAYLSSKQLLLRLINPTIKTNSRQWLWQVVGQGLILNW